MSMTSVDVAAEQKETTELNEPNLLIRDTNKRFSDYLGKSVTPLTMFLHAYNKTGNPKIRERIDQEWRNVSKRIEKFKEAGFEPTPFVNDLSLQGLSNLSQKDIFENDTFDTFRKLYSEIMNEKIEVK